MVSFSSSREEVQSSERQCKALLARNHPHLPVPLSASQHPRAEESTHDISPEPCCTPTQATEYTSSHPIATQLIPSPLNTPTSSPPPLLPSSFPKFTCLLTEQHFSSLNSANDQPFSPGAIFPAIRCNPFQIFTCVQKLSARSRAGKLCGEPRRHMSFPAA